MEVDLYVLFTSLAVAFAFGFIIAAFARERDLEDVKLEQIELIRIEGVRLLE